MNTPIKLWGFVCEHCGLHSGEAYRGDNPQNHAPNCCGGEPMTPYEISLEPKEANHAKENNKE